jgi:hypothetical protein
MSTNEVLHGYETAAYWSSNSETDLAGGEPLDNYMAANDTEPSEKCRARMREDVEAFLASCESANIDLSECDMSQVGHDLWLTRNRHGVGFWDRDAATYGTAERRDALDRLAKAMGEVYLYVDTEKNTVEHD